MPSSFVAEGLKHLIDVGIAGITQAKVALLQETYTPSDQHTVSDITSHRVAGTTDQNVTIASENDAANTRIEIDVTTGGGSVTFSAVPAGDNVRYAALYDDAATDKLIAIWDRGSNLPTNGEDITLTFSQSDGSLQLTY